MDPDRRIELAKKMLGQSLYNYQIDYLLAGNDPSKTGRIVLKGRQTGLTTVACIEACIDSLALPNYLTLLVSTKESQSKDLLDKIRVYLRKLGESVYREALERDSSTELLFSNGSRILALSQEPSAARSHTANHVILDEFAFFNEPERLLEAVNPSTVRKGRLTIISTPNGRNLFYELWLSKEDMGYWSQEVPWDSCPDLKPEVMDEQRARLRRLGKSWEQEYACSFDIKADAIWSAADLEDITLREWAPGVGIRYLGWDPAQLLHNSAVVVLERKKDTVEVVHLDNLRGIPYPEQASKIIKLVQDMGIRKLCLDNTGIGKACADLLLPIRGKVKAIHDYPKFRLEQAHRIRAKGEEGLFFIRDLPWSQELKADLFSFDPVKGTFPETKQGHGDFGAALFLAYSLTQTPTGFLNSWRPTLDLFGTRGCLADQQAIYQ